MDMQMTVSRGRVPDQHTGMLARELAALNGPCVGCADCKGLCAPLIDALTLPDLVLSKGRSE